MGKEMANPLWSGHIYAHVIKLEKYNDDVASPIKQNIRKTQSPNHSGCNQIAIDKVTGTEEPDQK